MSIIRHILSPFPAAVAQLGRSAGDKPSERWHLRGLMPVIARFYGIAIRMYFREHGVPHFHAIYGDFSGVFEIETLEMIEGELPQRAQRLVRDWAEQHHADLQEMWRTQRFQELTGLD